MGTAETKLLRSHLLLSFYMLWHEIGNDFNPGCDTSWLWWWESIYMLWFWFSFQKRNYDICTKWLLWRISNIWSRNDIADGFGSCSIFHLNFQIFLFHFTFRITSLANDIDFKFQQGYKATFLNEFEFRNVFYLKKYID